MTENLTSLYKSKWNDLCNAMQPIIDNEDFDIKPACPLLIGVEDEEEYKSADIRLMIFGKETNNWFQLFNKNIDEVQEQYEYFLSGDWELDTKRVFWQGLKPYINAIKAKYPEKKLVFIWNNIIKIGRFDEKGTPPDYIYNIEKKYFSVVKEEINILKPNLILFFTGPDYDDRLKDNFGELKFNRISALPECELASFELMNIKNVFRTYHPRGIRSFGKGYMQKCFSAIIDAINLDDPTNFELYSLNKLEDMLSETIVERETVVKNKDFEMASLLRNKEKLIKAALNIY